MDAPPAGTETSGLEPGDGRRAPSPPSGHRTVWWALLFAAVTTVGLALLAWELLIMHALTYGTTAVLRSSPIPPPDATHYRLAFIVAVIVNLAGASTLARLASQTSARTWPPLLPGLTAAVLAGAAAGCALLLTLGIDPIDFVTA